ncbi:hypothetical protein B2J93_8073 [Marssonina coronariae]|uniref:Uncharacterized protein n=1 Tax=Diplocarpon coronariae TaxID=2795749 RepID=A0A218ZB75_9HELO|nr:hypothetical protein B2J93_8073 [Marssonina coronariae]
MPPGRRRGRGTGDGACPTRSVEISMPDTEAPTTTTFCKRNTLDPLPTGLLRASVPLAVHNSPLAPRCPRPEPWLMAVMTFAYILNVRWPHLLATSLVLSTWSPLTTYTPTIAMDPGLARVGTNALAPLWDCEWASPRADAGATSLGVVSANAGMGSGTQYSQADDGDRGGERGRCPGGPPGSGLPALELAGLRRRRRDP